MLIDHVNKALIYPLLTENGFLKYVSDVFDILGLLRLCFKNGEMERK